MVRAETADAVRRDVRGVREVPEVLGWHSDFPDFIAVRHLPVELSSESTSMGMRAIVDRGDLLRKIHFPNYIIVASTTMGSMISRHQPCGGHPLRFLRPRTLHLAHPTGSAQHHPAVLPWSRRCPASGLAVCVFP